MKPNILERKQILSADIKSVWTFFSNPENLNELTPDDMGFKILSETPIPKMHEGQIIEYKVSPILGIPIYWKTVIKEVVHFESFVDIQEKGPYKLWKHTHTFKQEGENIVMKDRVEYLLPLGVLGQMLNPIYVKAKLESIFDYRYKRINHIFNELHVV